MFSALFIALTSTLSSGATLQGNPNIDYAEYEAAGVETIRVTNTSGKITVSPMPLNKITVTMFKRRFTEHCATLIQKPDATLILAEFKPPANERCEVDIELQVPKDIRLDLTEGSGNVSIRGFDGKLDFKVGSGSLVAEGHVKNVDGTVGSGDVTIKGMAGGGKLLTGSGKVNLRFLEDLRGQLDLKSGSGDTTLAFPKGTALHTSLASGSGAVENELGDNPDADFGLNAKTGSGDLRVQSY